jgi:hypothetical protein
MSQTDIVRFIQALEQAPVARAELGTMLGSDGADPKRAIFTASARLGFPLDTDDVEALLASARALTASGGEISDDDLDGVAGGASLADLNLQNTLQKSSQTLGLMSRIGKASSDANLSMIRKFGG